MIIIRGVVKGLAAKGALVYRCHAPEVEQTRAANTLHHPHTIIHHPLHTIMHPAGQGQGARCCSGMGMKASCSGMGFKGCNAAQSIPMAFKGCSASSVEQGGPGGLAFDSSPAAVGFDSSHQMRVCSRLQPIDGLAPWRLAPGTMDACAVAPVGSTPLSSCTAGPAVISRCQPSSGGQIPTH